MGRPRKKAIEAGQATLTNLELGIRRNGSPRREHLDILIALLGLWELGSRAGDDRRRVTV
jgi:hypothetical protein